MLQRYLLLNRWISIVLMTFCIEKVEYNGAQLHMANGHCTCTFQINVFNTVNIGGESKGYTLGVMLMAMVQVVPIVQVNLKG